MNVISLTVKVPDGISPDRFEQLSHVIADAAHRCTDWEDQATWDIVQTDGRELIVRTPDPRRRLAGTSGGTA